MFLREFHKYIGYNKKKNHEIALYNTKKIRTSVAGINELLYAYNCIWIDSVLRFGPDFDGSKYLENMICLITDNIVKKDCLHHTLPVFTSVGMGYSYNVMPYCKRVKNYVFRIKGFSISQVTDTNGESNPNQSSTQTNECNASDDDIFNDEETLKTIESQSGIQGSVNNSNDGDDSDGEGNDKRRVKKENVPSDFEGDNESKEDVEDEKVSSNAEVKTTVKEKIGGERASLHRRLFRSYSEEVLTNRPVMYNRRGRARSEGDYSNNLLERVCDQIKRKVEGADDRLTSDPGSSLDHIHSSDEESRARLLGSVNLNESRIDESALRRYSLSNPTFSTRKQVDPTKVLASCVKKDDGSITTPCLSDSDSDDNMDHMLGAAGSVSMKRAKIGNKVSDKPSLLPTVEVADTCRSARKSVKIVNYAEDEDEDIYETESDKYSDDEEEDECLDVSYDDTISSGTTSDSTEPEPEPEAEEEEIVSEISENTDSIFDTSKGTSFGSEVTASTPETGDTSERSYDTEYSLLKESLESTSVDSSDWEESDKEKPSKNGKKDRKTKEVRNKESKEGQKVDNTQGETPSSKKDAAEGDGGDVDKCAVDDSSDFSIDLKTPEGSDTTGGNSPSLLDEVEDKKRSRSEEKDDQEERNTRRKLEDNEK